MSTAQNSIGVVIVGAGDRGSRVYAHLIATEKTAFHIAGVVEPDPRRRARFAEQHALPSEHAYASVDELLRAKAPASLAFICTPDRTHASIACQLLEAGYDLLMEKPIASTEDALDAVSSAANSGGRRVFVAHVLRYAPFFQSVRDLVRSGRFGSVRYVLLQENVGHWHFAHSYVRGPWASEKESSPILLAKSSHDLDLLCWILGEAPDQVISTATRTHFRRENRPAEATDRCHTCPLSGSCLYSATRFYDEESRDWPHSVIGPPGQRHARLEHGPYGRCVYHEGNDVPDTQSVLLRFPSGTTANFALLGLSAENSRTLRILCEQGEIEGDLLRGRLHVRPLTGRPELHDPQVIPISEAKDGHGGGDLGLLRTLGDHLRDGRHADVVTTLESSLLSHRIAFAAERSRWHGGAPASLLPPA